jgi:hypothetical protein
MELTTHLFLVPRSKNAWSYTSTPQYAFMAWCSVVKSTGTTFLPTLKDVVSGMKGNNKKLFITHLGAMKKQFSFYFEDTNVSKFEWVRNSFAIYISSLTTCKQGQDIPILQHFLERHV